MLKFDCVHSSAGVGSLVDRGPDVEGIFPRALDGKGRPFSLPFHLKRHQHHLGSTPAHHPLSLNHRALCE